MGKVTTIKGNLFDAPKGSIIIHACNTKGVWGSGIAKAFASKFPNARDVYAKACQEKGASLLGTCLLIPAGDYIIGCLFTSKNYGQFVDKPAKILESTESAIKDLIKQNVDKRPLHTCKINSGLFRVPWNDTKALLKASDSDFVVYDY
jgi:ADP-ribose 1''-phosphate phosphatase